MYDYIIVGGGSAGCVMANRLSEDPKNNVCLLEAGADDTTFLNDLLIKTPLGIGALMWNPLLNWMYFTEKEKNMGNRRMYQPRGKVLGGSGSINAMIYTRGVASDYDEWEALGNKGWGFKDLLPLFKRGQNQQRGGSEFHGEGGPLNVGDPRQVNQMCHVFADAGEEIGIPKSDDFNADGQEGVGVFQVTQEGGQRCSPSKAYLQPVRSRPNLTVITKAMASKIILQDNRAVGVIYRQGKQVHRIMAAKEVVLSAGAINSPQLLMLSGIGPKEELSKHGIPLAHELPGVGKNLQDHLDVILIEKSSQKESYGFSWQFGLKALMAPFEYIKSKSGLLASNAAEAGGFAKTDPSLDQPDVQFHFTPSWLRNHGLAMPEFGHCYSLHVCLLRPKSRGEITLKDSNPKSKAKIKFNYLEHPDDVTGMISAVKLAKKLLSAKAFDAYREKSVHPGPEVDSDAKLEQFIRLNAETIYHPVGTCKMGDDELAVVDDQLRVHGVQGLRVVDASIMPTLIGGNTNGPTMVIAGKAADMMLSTDVVNEDEKATA